MDEPPRSRRIRLPFGVTFVHTPRPYRPSRHPSLAGVLFIIGLVVTALHELAYRQTGGSDFELGGTISHAGADMLAVVIILSVVALWLDRIRRTP